MISHRKGTNIYTKKFDNNIVDEQLLSGALTAMVSLFKEALPVGNVQKIQINNIVVLYSSINDIKFFYIFKGNCELGEQRFIEFHMKLMQHEVWTDLKNFDHDTSSAIDSHLDEPIFSSF